MNACIIGASGFLGSELVDYLVSETDWNIKAVSLNGTNFGSDRVENISCNVFDTEKLSNVLEKVNVVYYFVHLMGQDGDYYKREADAARSCVEACDNSGVEKIIYMSGLGSDDEDLSKHLRSRHNTGHILRESESFVIEFRASMIIGEESVSFSIVKNLVEKLPVMLLPPTVNTKTQPIGVSDVLKYLREGVIVDLEDDQIVEIGGSEVMSYKGLLEKYSSFIDKNVFLLSLPWLPDNVAGWWLSLFVDENEARIGKRMIESFRNEMIVTNSKAKKLFPDIKPRDINKDFT